MPPLLFADGWLMPLRDFLAVRCSILFLASGLVVFTTLAVGLVAHALVPGLPWAMAFALGAVISPADAVAVSAITHRLKVPARLTAVLNGESLLNDATGLVAFKFALGAMVAGTFSLGAATLDFALVAVGGLAVGLAVSYRVGRIRDLLRTLHSTDGLVEVTLSLMTPYAAYLFADALGLSSILAVVAAGLYAGWRDPVKTDVATRQTSQKMWSVVLFWLNGHAFILLGLQIPAILATVSGHYSTAQLVRFTSAVAGVTIIGRVLLVFPAAYLPFRLSARVRREEKPPPWQSVLVCGWAGMRGTLTLAAALSIPVLQTEGSAFPGRDIVIFLALGVIVVTLLLHGTTLEWLICRLGLGDNGTGATSLVKSGAGTWTLSGGNYTGPTTVIGGVLAVGSHGNGGSSSSIGRSSSAASNLVLDGGTLRFVGKSSSKLTDRLFTLGINGGTLDASGDSHAPLTLTNFGSVALAGANTARTLTLAGTGSATLSPALGDNGTGATSLAKTGTGTWTLSGANTYTGPTTISAGTLALAGTSSNNMASSATISLGATARLDVTGLSQGALVLANNQTLAGSGTVSGKITATTGLAHLAPGGSGAVGTLTIGSLVLSDHLALDFDFASLSIYDTLNVTALNGLSLLGGRFNLLNAGAATPFTGLGTFDLITFAGSLQDPTDILATLTASSILNAAAGLTYAFSVTGGDTLALTIDSRHHQWQAEHFGSTAALTAQAAADPDHDGVPNLLEYALGTDPLAASTTSLPVAAATVSAADSLPHLTLTATLAAAAGDVSVDAEVSGDLVNWQSGAAFIEVASDTTTGAVRTLILRDTAPLGAGPPRFMRLRVSLP